MKGQEQPKYLQIAEYLRAGIHDGTFPVGQPLPSEEDLARQFGVTRPTVRQGIAELRTSGLVNVVNGRGTFVRTPEPGKQTAVSLDEVSLGQIRAELMRLTAIAGSAERPKPTRINGPDHAWPGYEWDLSEMPAPYSTGTRTKTWMIRTCEEDKDEQLAEGLVYVSTPESMYPGLDFVPMYASDARRLGMALLAAADRAEHQALGVPRLEDRRGEHDPR